MTKAITITYGVFQDHIAKVTSLVLMACLIVAGIYIFHTYSLVNKTVALRTIDGQMTALSGDVQGLDAKYLDLVSRITPENLGTFGLKQGTVSDYISRVDGVDRVAMVAHEF